MVELLGGEQYAQLIQCFLNPDLMVARHEHFVKSLPHVSKHEPDPLCALFHASDFDHLSKLFIMSLYCKVTPFGTSIVKFYSMYYGINDCNLCSIFRW